jgi:chromosome segregation ATPase
MISLTNSVVDGDGRHPPGFDKIADIGVDAAALAALLPKLGSFSDEVQDLGRNMAKAKADLDTQLTELLDFQWATHALRAQVLEGQAVLARQRDALKNETTQAVAALEARQADLAARTRAADGREGELKQRSMEVADMRRVFATDTKALESDQKRHASELADFEPKAELLEKKRAELDAVNLLGVA